MKRAVDFSLYLITRDIHLPSLNYIVQQAVEGGVTIVQLRAKEMSTRQFVDIGERLLGCLKPLGVPLIINDRVDIAHAIKADGVHLGQSDLGVSEARAILGTQAIIGLSVETMEQAQTAEIEEVDYLAASPVFFTKTKQDCAESWGLKGLQQLCAFSSYPIIAIGGINHSNHDAVWKCGVHGIAVVSAIFDADDPKCAARKFMRLNE